MNRQEASDKYGILEHDKWIDEAKHCILLEVPAGFEHWINSATGLPFKHIYCNQDMAGPLLAALNNILDRGLSDQVHTFDGCLMVRMQRGSTSKPSWHCYALAIDINAASNPLGGPVTISPELKKCFTDAGFISGADFHRIDGMHFQLGED